MNLNYSVMKRVFLVQMLLVLHMLSYAQKNHVILITYYSSTGKTAQMAEAVQRGVKTVKGVDVFLKRIEETTKEDLLKTDAIILGSPVHNANPAPEILKFIEGWPFEGSPMKNKLGAVFVTGGGISSGEELVQTSLIHAMMVFGMVMIGGDDWTASFGASAITDEGPFKGKPDEVFLKKGEKLGERVAKSVLRWNK